MQDGLDAAQEHPLILHVEQGEIRPEMVAAYKDVMAWLGFYDEGERFIEARQRYFAALDAEGPRIFDRLRKE